MLGRAAHHARQNRVARRMLAAWCWLRELLLLLEVALEGSGRALGVGLRVGWPPGWIDAGHRPIDDAREATHLPCVGGEGSEASVIEAEERQPGADKGDGRDGHVEVRRFVEDEDAHKYTWGGGGEGGDEGGGGGG